MSNKAGERWRWQHRTALNGKNSDYTSKKYWTRRKTEPTGISKLRDCFLRLNSSITFISVYNVHIFDYIKYTNELNRKKNKTQNKRQIKASVMTLKWLSASVHTYCWPCGTRQTFDYFHILFVYCTTMFVCSNVWLHVCSCTTDTEFNTLTFTIDSSWHFDTFQIQILL